VNAFLFEFWFKEKRSNEEEKNVEHFIRLFLIGSFLPFLQKNVRKFFSQLFADFFAIVMPKKFAEWQIRQIEKRKQTVEGEKIGDPFQDCQIFLYTIYQKWCKIYQIATKLPNGNKIY
jgi:hypothetical protein